MLSTLWEWRNYIYVFGLWLLPVPAIAQNSASSSSDPGAVEQNSDALHAPKEHYPPGALADLVEGKTVYKVTVTEDGRAENCVIVETSGSPELDAGACKMLIGSTRFRIAMNEAGQPVQYEHSGSVVFKQQFKEYDGSLIPVQQASIVLAVEQSFMRQLGPADEWATSVRLDISERGKLAGCELVKTTGSQKLDGSICKRVKRVTTFKAGRDAAGNPKRMSVEMEVRLINDGFWRG